MGELVIREVVEADFDRIRQIAEAAWKNTYEWRRGVMDPEIYQVRFGEGHPEKGRRVEAWCRENPALTRVAELDGQVVGFITWRLNSTQPGTGQVSNNAVAPEAQGRGVGRAMYEWVFDEFRRAGMKYAVVHTAMDPGHAPARAAYQKVGFAWPLESVQYYRKL